MSGFALLVCHLNIAKFRALLATPVDEAQRRVLTALLAEEQSREVGSSRVDLQACKLEYSIVSPK